MKNFLLALNLMYIFFVKHCNLH